MKGLRRTITVEPELLAKINKFRADHLMKNIEIDFTKAINMLADLGITTWEPHDKSPSLIRGEIFFKYLGQSIAESIIVTVLNKQDKK